jgi:hypothetical protein
MPQHWPFSGRPMFDFMPFGCGVRAPRTASITILAVLLFITGCLPDELDSSPVPPRTVDGVFLLDGPTLSFSPCGYPERWYLTPDSVLRPGEYLVRAPSDKLSPFTKTGGEQPRPFDRTDSLSEPPPPPDTLRSFETFSPVLRDSLASALPKPDSVSLDSVSVLHGEIRGYGTEHARFGPLGRFDRVFVTASVTGVEVGRSCPFLAR